MPDRVSSTSRPLMLLSLLGCAALLLLLFLARKAIERSAAPKRNSSAAASSSAESIAARPSPAPLPAKLLAAPSASAKDPLDELFASALAHTDPDRRRELLRAIADHLADHDLERAKDYIQGILTLHDRAANGDAYTFTKIFAGKLAARDPQAVIAWAHDLPTTLKDLAFQFVARHWGERDPRALAQWGRTLDDSVLRATVIRATAQQLLHADPTHYGPTWAADLARTPDGLRFSDIVVRQWAKTDPTAAQAWAQQLPDADDRTNAFFALSTTLAEKDPRAALAWTADLPEGETRSRCVQNSITLWAAQDPAAAAAWVNQHAATPGLVENTLHPIASAWLQKDPVAARRWLETAPVKPEMKDYLLTTSAARRPNS